MINLYKETRIAAFDSYSVGAITRHTLLSYSRAVYILYFHTLAGKQPDSLKMQFSW